MRNLLLLLLLANILYFMWGMFAGDDTDPGIAIVDEGELGPPARVLGQRDRLLRPLETQLARHADAVEGILAGAAFADFVRTADLAGIERCISAIPVKNSDRR